MLSQLFESLLSSWSSSTITDIFIGFVVIVFFTAIFARYRNKSPRFLQYAPTLMTALGILGTFVGVVIGLLHFDTTNIEESIPVLLGGLKTAFITSIVGMLGALVYNVVDMLFFSEKTNQNQQAQPESVTPDHIHQVLLAQHKVLERIAFGLDGNDEVSLVGQLKLLRTDMNDMSKVQNKHREEFSQKLWSELTHFGELMAKGATEQIIDALRKVIADFNNNLTEQFGENFKALDSSVKKLVEWQRSYKEQVDVMGEQYKQSVDSLMATKQSVAGIWEECKEIPLAMAELRDVLSVNQHQIKELSKHLEAFATLRDKALEAVPGIQIAMDEVGEQLKAGALSVSLSLEQTGGQLVSSANSMRVALEEGTEGFRNSVMQTQHSFASMAHDVANSSEKLTSTLGETVQEMKSSALELLNAMHRSVTEMGGKLQEHSLGLSGMMKTQSEDLANVLKTHSGSMLDTLQSAFEKANSGLTTNVGEAIGRFGEAINSQLKAFGEATDQEMNRELQILGNSLISISKGFVNNYETLAKEYAVVMGQLQSVINQTTGK
ncbi:type II Zorya anti-phage system protein ZorA2 [Rahnella sp. AN3-3W3]|uniref:type II Zorya anti-phage system protein ZorA2 n=1 Tax=Rahnella sp. AN3-3W3 TaxID=1610578 RepID=UPI000DD42DA6|nr:type II Zorya anti-phage system protein ZorA2 [Rahnella sp. AN3-3W3]